MKLVSVGTVAFDDITTPKGRAEKAIGGAATYISRAASYFVDSQGIVSVVGEDFPKSELDEMKAIGIDLKGLQIRAGEKSFFWAGRYHSNMNHRDTLVTDLNVLADFDPIMPPAYRTVDYLMLGNLTPAVQARVLDQMEKRPKLIALDTMNFWMDSMLDDLLQVIKRIDVLSINEEEARQLSGEYALTKAAEVIHRFGPKYLIIKRGEYGCVLFHENKVFAFPALLIDEVIDPTGAGDTFIGGFMGYLAKTDDLSFENMKRAIIYASILASYCVEEFSLSRLKSITTSDIEARLNQFKGMTMYEI